MKRDKGSKSHRHAQVAKSECHTPSNRSESEHSDSARASPSKRLKRDIELDIDMTISEYEDSCVSAPRRNKKSKHKRESLVSENQLEERINGDGGSKSNRRVKVAKNERLRMSSPSESELSDSVRSPQSKRLKRDVEHDLDMTISEYEDSCVSAPRRNKKSKHKRVTLLSDELPAEIELPHGFELVSFEPSSKCDNTDRLLDSTRCVIAPLSDKFDLKRINSMDLRIGGKSKIIQSTSGSADDIEDHYEVRIQSHDNTNHMPILLTRGSVVGPITASMSLKRVIHTADICAPETSDELGIRRDWTAPLKGGDQDEPLTASSKKHRSKSRRHKLGRSLIKNRRTMVGGDEPVVHCSSKQMKKDKKKKSRESKTLV